MREVWALQFMRGTHPIHTKNRGRILYQGHVIAKFHCVATGRFDAGIGDQPDHDHLTEPMLLQLHVEIGVRKTVLAPMLFDDDVARLRREIGMPLPAPAMTPAAGRARTSVTEKIATTAAPLSIQERSKASDRAPLNRTTIVNHPKARGPRVGTKSSFAPCSGPTMR
jgi:hypothetical protein